MVVQPVVTLDKILNDCPDESAKTFSHQYCTVLEHNTNVQDNTRDEHKTLTSQCKVNHWARLCSKKVMRGPEVPEIKTVGSK